MPSLANTLAPAAPMRAAPAAAAAAPLHPTTPLTEGSTDQLAPTAEPSTAHPATEALLAAQPELTQLHGVLEESQRKERVLNEQLASKVSFTEHLLNTHLAHARAHAHGSHRCPMCLVHPDRKSHFCCLHRGLRRTPDHMHTCPVAYICTPVHIPARRTPDLPIAGSQERLEPARSQMPGQP